MEVATIFCTVNEELKINYVSEQKHKYEKLMVLHQELSFLKEGIDSIWNQKIFFLRLRGIEESKLFSSFTTGASRRRRSGSFWENKGKSSESIHTIYLFIGLTIDGKHVWQQEESKKEIPVLFVVMASGRLWMDGGRLQMGMRLCSGFKIFLCWDINQSEFLIF